MDEGIRSIPLPERIEEEAGDSIVRVKTEKLDLPLTRTTAGRIATIRGSVIDVVFPRDLPGLHEALKVTNEDGRDLILEVEQIFGPETVRAIALGNTEGLTRGVAVERTGQGIHVPV